MKSPGHSDPCLCSACLGKPVVSPLLSLQDIGLVRDGRCVLDDINLTVDRGDFVAITGPNGGGKTTLLRIILGLIRPTSGKLICYDDAGTPVARLPRPGYLPQKNTVDSHFPITVGEVVASGLLAAGDMTKEEKKEKIERTLSLVQLCDLARRPIGRLSGGQLQRTLFGRAIVAEPPLLILDEPMSYLDINFEERLYDIIAELSKKATVLLVSHQMNRLGAMANRHVIVDHTLRECTHRHHYCPPEC